MSLGIEVKWDDSEVRLWQGTHMESAMLRALNRAGIDTIRRTRAEANRRVRERKAVKVSEASKGLRMVFPWSAKNWNTLVWKLGFSGKPIPVYKYGRPRQVKQGVAVTINVGKRVTIRSAFISKMKSEHIGVFKRVGKKRLPIKELLSTRVSDVGQDFIEPLANKAAITFSSAFARTMGLELERAAR
jgi:hypothetical protein